MLAELLGEEACRSTRSSVGRRCMPKALEGAARPPFAVRECTGCSVVAVERGDEVLVDFGPISASHRRRGLRLRQRRGGAAVRRGFRVGLASGGKLKDRRSRTRTGVPCPQMMAWIRSTVWEKRTALPSFETPRGYVSR